MIFFKLKILKLKSESQIIASGSTLSMWIPIIKYKIKY